MSSRDVSGQDGLWKAVREVAAAAAGSADAPPGFVRRDLEVGDEQLGVYARVPESGEPSPALVVVVASPGPMRPTSKELQRRFRLTPREAEVALLLAARRSNKEIARELGIAQSTAWGHTERVLAKLGTGSRRDVGRIISDGPASAGGGDEPLERLAFAS